MRVRHLLEALADVDPDFEVQSWQVDDDGNVGYVLVQIATVNENSRTVRLR